MRIPAELIPLARNPARELEESRKAEPVGTAARLANDLAATPQGQAALVQRDYARAPAAALQAPPVEPEARSPFVERRQGDRRRENRPVLLDTRAKRNRRQANAGSIDIEV